MGLGQARGTLVAVKAGGGFCLDLTPKEIDGAGPGGDIRSHKFLFIPTKSTEVLQVVKSYRTLLENMVRRMEEGEE